MRLVSLSTMLCVSDVERSAEWYRVKLGFEVVKQGPAMRSCASTPARECGVEFLTPPKSPPWGGWRCFAHDPDSYLVEIEDWAAELHRS
jgi:hypothetical protein